MLSCSCVLLEYWYSSAVLIFIPTLLEPVAWRPSRLSLTHAIPSKNGVYNRVGGGVCGGGGGDGDEGCGGGDGDEGYVGEGGVDDVDGDEGCVVVVVVVGVVWVRGVKVEGASKEC